jgi:hypothetical protein
LRHDRRARRTPDAVAATPVIQRPSRILMLLLWT